MLKPQAPATQSDSEPARSVPSLFRRVRRPRRAVDARRGSDDLLQPLGPGFEGGALFDVERSVTPRMNDEYPMLIRETALFASNRCE